MPTITKRFALCSPLAECRGLLVWLIVCVGLFGASAVVHAQDTSGNGSVVRVVTDASGWALEFNGQPYFIKGGGGQHHLQALVDAGGNSIRTWGADDAGEVLDRAHKLGLTVTIGIWLEHERHGINYGDADAVARQLEKTKRVIEKYKNHPALLMWGLGNEVEAGGDNQLIWKAINDIARMTKEVDPNHPTMTVIAEIGENEVKIKNLLKYCPDIDVLGINTYGGMPSIGKRTAEAGLDRPYIAAEYGPLGQWEVGMTQWGAPIEQNSSRKAKFCADGYKQSILDQPGRCLGGYVFVWGNKQEVTPTWYTLIQDDGTATETIDVMTRFWTGAWPANRAPLIKDLQILSVNPNHVKAGAKCRAQVDTLDPDGDELEIHWVVQSESTDRKSGGDFEKTPEVHGESIGKDGDRGVDFKAPSEPGGYRLFVYIRDGQGHVGTANVPFMVVR